MSSKPSHKVVMPPHQVLALAVKARQEIRDADREERDPKGIHVGLWRAQGDGVSLFEHRGKQIRVYKDPRVSNEQEKAEEEPIEQLSRK